MATATFDDNNAPGMGMDNSRKLWVEFHMEAVQDPEASAKEARPIFRDEEFITIRIPGDKDNDVVRAVREADKRAYAEQYAAFKAGKEQPVTGTPLDQLPFLTKAQRAEFAAVNVRTAEQLRDMPDSVSQRFMGIHGLRKRTADFLEAAAGAAPAIALRAELEKRDGEIEVLKRALEDQGKKIEEMLKAKQRG